MKLAKTVIKNEWIRHQVNHYGEQLAGLGDVVCDAPKCDTRFDNLQFVLTRDKDGKLSSLIFLCRNHFNEYMREFSLFKHRQYLINNDIPFEEFEYSDEELDNLR